MSSFPIVDASKNTHKPPSTAPKEAPNLALLTIIALGTISLIPGFVRELAECNLYEENKVRASEAHTEFNVEYHKFAFAQNQLCQNTTYPSDCQLAHSSSNFKDPQLAQQAKEARMAESRYKYYEQKRTQHCKSSNSR